MAVIKCKMCGGDLAVKEGSRVAECLYCGTKQTVPFADSDKKITLFARAGRLLRACEFDKAAGIFESIVAEFPEEAEAYWGLILCRFGIEYVDDPATGKKVPTCHRSGSESVFDDPDYEQTYENAGPEERKLYREEAKKIEELRKSIIDVSRNEKPYDIFICYKETDPDGGRTVDSVIAQDVYEALTEKKYRVFFSRITLEDKLGTEYEPYIYAALNSAKIMLVIGTEYENFDAVWVKNEWSRFLKLMEKDRSRHLIPCYKGIDAYDMPKEFQRLQAQDMGKVGAMQDLVRGISKILPKETAAPSQQQAWQSTNVPRTPANLEVERGYEALYYAYFDSASRHFNKALSYDPALSSAHIGKLLASNKCMTREAFEAKISENFIPSGLNYEIAKNNASDEDAKWMKKIEAKKGAVMLELHRKAVERDAERAAEERQRRLDAARQRLPEAKDELANLKGLFTGKRRKELEEEIARLTAEIKALEPR